MRRKTATKAMATVRDQINSDFVLTHSRAYCQNPLCICQDKKRNYDRRFMFEDGYYDMLFHDRRCADIYRDYPGKRIKNSIYL